jgi:hypothetical protein
MPLLNDADRIYVGSSLVAKVYLGTTLVWSYSLDYSKSHNSGYLLLLMV